MQDLLRVGAIIAAVGSGAAFLTALNIMALMVPETSTTRPKSKPQEQTPAPTAPARAVFQTPTRATSESVEFLKVTGGSGKYQGATGGGTYFYENLTDTLSGGTYKETIQLP